MVQEIDSFKGDFFFLSNFYERPVLYEGLVYQNTEAAFQAAKCESIHDRMQFCTLRPSQAKQLGRRVHLRSDWEEVKDQIMRDILQCKFSQSPHLKKLLLETGDALLVEGNTWHDRDYTLQAHSVRGGLGVFFFLLIENYILALFSILWYN